MISKNINFYAAEKNLICVSFYWIIFASDLWKKKHERIKLILIREIMKGVVSFLNLSMNQHIHAVFSVVQEKRKYNCRDSIRNQCWLEHISECSFLGVFILTFRWRMVSTCKRPSKFIKYFINHLKVFIFYDFIFEKHLQKVSKHNLDANRSTLKCQIILNPF